MNDEDYFVITRELFDDEDVIIEGARRIGKSTRTHIWLAYDGRWVTLPYRGPFVTQRLSDLDDCYSMRSSGKSVLLNVLALKELAKHWSPSPHSEQNAPCQSLRKPIKGISQLSLADAAVTGVPASERTTQVNRYTPERSDMCVNCLGRDRFEHTCNNYLSLREFSARGRVSVLDSFGTDRFFIDDHRNNGRA